MGSLDIIVRAVRAAESFQTDRVGRDQMQSSRLVREPGMWAAGTVAGAGIPSPTQRLLELSA